jgi:hypothetical protein
VRPGILRHVRDDYRLPRRFAVAQILGRVEIEVISHEIGFGAGHHKAAHAHKVSRAAFDQ